MPRALPKLVVRVLVFLALFCFLPFLWAQKNAGNTTRRNMRFGTARPDLPLDEWLRSGARKEFRWKVDASKPQLILQDPRFLVGFRARIDARDLVKDGTRDLFFFLKVADENGNWFDGEDYTPLPAAVLHPRLAANRNMDYIEAPMIVLLRPGNYRVAFIAYDRAHQERNLWQKNIVVPVDPSLADDQAHFPPVEFTTIEQLLQKSLPLELATNKPIHLDLISIGPYRNQYLWQSTLSLSRMQLANGCIHAHAIAPDQKVGDLKVIDFNSTDWGNETKRIFDLNRRARAMVDVHDLQTLVRRQTTSVALMRDVVLKAAAEDSACAAGSEPARHVIVVVNSTLDIPKHLLPPPISPAERSGTTLFYFHHRPNMPVTDKLGPLLKPDQSFVFDNPRQFHKSLDGLLNAIEGSR